MSIKPEFAHLIFSGQKKFEFRKKLFKNLCIKTVVVYASSPVQKVIGEFEIEELISLHPETLWKRTEKKSGITKEFFMEYFQEREMAHAIKIGKKKLYKKPLCLKRDFDMHPPQSFAYLL